MKILSQITLLATFLASVAASQQQAESDPKMRGSLKLNPPVVDPSQRRQLGNKKSKSFSLDEYPVDPAKPYVEGEVGERRECSDKRFTMVCEWEADKKKKKYYKSRRLADGAGTTALDFEDETEANKEDRELVEVNAPNGRKLKVELDHVECILGVGKKDSDDSSEDYEEYKERLKFPDDKWTIKIKKFESLAPENCVQHTDGSYYNKHGIKCDVVKVDYLDYYSFERKINFEDIEDPNNSGDEITITGTIKIELLCDDDAVVGGDHPEFLFLDDQELKFSC